MGIWGPYGEYFENKWEIEKGNEGGCDRDGKIAGERWKRGTETPITIPPTFSQ